MGKTALFGGTFDPIHPGHMDCIEHLVTKMNFSEVILIPASQNPLKTHQKKPTPPVHRLKMIELALSKYNKSVKVDCSEIFKHKPSYTYQTLRLYKKKYKFRDLYFVMGLDTFEKFDQWKNFHEILKTVCLLVISRPSCTTDNLKNSNLPKDILNQIKLTEGSPAELDASCRIHFLKLKTKDISSSLIKKKIKKGEDLSRWLDPEIEKYIKQNNLYL